MSAAPPVVSPLISAQALVRRFGAVTALGGVSLEVDPGEMVLLLGPNGAGKTTLLRALAGLVRPAKGRVRIEGGDVNRDPEARRAIGFLSHHALLYDDLTPRENLRFATALHQLDNAERRIDAALAEADLVARADRPVRGFSRGMLQRLALARATLHEPTVLLLDEPFTGLDVSAATTLRDRVERHRAAGGAIVAVTHEPADLWDVATRVVVLIAGKVVLSEARTGELAAFRVRYAGLLAS
jgi:heme exporter protein A